MPSDGSPEDYDRTDAARRLWRRCRAIDGTHAEAYLRARAIHRCRFTALRASTPRSSIATAAAFAACRRSIAAVTGDAGEHPGPGERPGHGAIAGVQRTWLDPDRPAKAPVSRPRKALGRVHGHRRPLRRIPPPARSSSAKASRRCCRSSPRYRTSPRPPRSPPAASAPSRLRPASRASSSPATTTPKASARAARLVRRCACDARRRPGRRARGRRLQQRSGLPRRRQALAARLAPVFTPPGPGGRVKPGAGERRGEGERVLPATITQTRRAPMSSRITFGRVKRGRGPHLPGWRTRGRSLPSARRPECRRRTTT